MVNSNHSLSEMPVTDLTARAIVMYPVGESNKPHTSCSLFINMSAGLQSISEGVFVCVTYLLHSNIVC